MNVCKKMELYENNQQILISELHQEELLTDWDMCQKSLVPNKIQPLR